jgi:hypothetical protein
MHMEYETRKDHFTGALSAHPDHRSKPFPPTPRVLPELRHACSLCALAASPINENNEVTDGDVSRPALLSSDLSLTVSNKWVPFGPSSRADLIILRRHVTSLEEATDEEIEDLLSQMLQMKELHKETYEYTLTSINVGLSASSTQPHLHGQVVSTELQQPPPLIPYPFEGALLADEELARDNDLILTNNASHMTYVPYAPTISGEIRVVATTKTDLASALKEALLLLQRAYGEVSYNIVLSTGEKLVAQILPCLIYSGLRPWYFGINMIVIPPSDLAATLRSLL